MPLGTMHIAKPLGAITMKFEQIIRTELERLLKNHGFEIGMVDLHNVNFQSAKMTLRFIYNSRESSFGYWVKHVDFEEEYENWIVEKFLEIEREAVFGEFNQEQKAIRWANWIAQYFQENQKRFLDGEDEFFKELNSYFSELTTDYNNDIQLEFIQKQISEAWQQKDYRKLANLKIADITGISQSEMKKIEIAKARIKAPNKT